MSWPTRLKIYEFLAWPGHMWLEVCSWLVGGSIFWGLWEDEEDWCDECHKAFPEGAPSFVLCVDCYKELKDG